jgi:GT2 family glycosyltransferase
MKLSVIIVNYNVRYYIEQCLNSVLKATKGIDTEIFVVDNHSHDGSVNYLHRHFGDRITLVESNHNQGFARANNIAIRQSSGEYVLLLNPDTFVGEQTISTVLRFMDEHPQAGGAGVHMHNSDGSTALESRRGLPTPFVSLLKMMGFPRRYYMSHLPWDQPGQIDVMSGAFMMLRRSVLDQVGLLDEDFFMYGEDIDLSYRILKAGFQNWYVPAPIVHYKGESTQKSSFRYVHVFYQAMLIFFRKHYGHLSLLVTLPIKTAIYARAFVALVSMGYWRTRRSLGFTSKRDRMLPVYCFVGSKHTLSKCRKLSLRKGLDARFASHRDKAEPCDVLVYDADTYSYDEIIAHAASRSATPSPVQIGTYSCKTHVLITPREIIL